MRTTPPILLFGATALAIACAPPPDIGDGGLDDGGGDAMADGGADGDGGGGLDEARLDRDGSGGACGHPSGGSRGYGTDVGKRLANNVTMLQGCEGDAMQLADLFCPRDDAYGDYNRGIFINIAAGWCGPCQDETLEFPELYEEFHDRGIEFLQVLYQDWNAQTPTKAFCSDWSQGRWVGEGGSVEMVDIDVEYTVVIDQVFDWTSLYLQDPASATPVNMLVDANGNIRWKVEGQRPDPAVLRSQFELVIADPYGDD